MLAPSGRGLSRRWIRLLVAQLALRVSLGVPVPSNGQTLNGQFWLAAGAAVLLEAAILASCPVRFVLLRKADLRDVRSRPTDRLLQGT